MAGSGAPFGHEIFDSFAADRKYLSQVLVQVPFHLRQRNRPDVCHGKLVRVDDSLRADIGDPTRTTAFFCAGCTPWPGPLLSLARDFAVTGTRRISFPAWQVITTSRRRSWGLLGRAAVQGRA